MAAGGDRTAARRVKHSACNLQQNKIQVRLMVMDTKFSTALHVLTFISESERAADSRALAESVNTNASHIRKLASQLKSAGIVESHQGRAGFTLAKPSSQIKLSDVYCAVYPTRSILNVHSDANQECLVGRHVAAVLEPTFARVEATLLESLAEITLDDLVASFYKTAKETQEQV